jgi:hypothetical protein
MATAAPTPGTEGQLLAAGLYQLLSPVVEECDARIQEVMDSQAHLSQQIETLAADLDHFMTFTQTPPLAAHLQRLLNSRNRLATINTTLLTIMNRLDKIAVGVDPQAKERKVSIGGLFNKRKDSQTLPPQPQQLVQSLPLSQSQPLSQTQPQAQPQAQQLVQPIQPQEQPVQQSIPQETKTDDATPSENKENNDEQPKSEPQKEVSEVSQETEK